ncbi:MAG: glycosyltransferase [Chitinophagaceae bacterium]
MADQFLSNKDVIIFALKSWDTEIGSSSKEYAKVLARNNNRVLFVNRALDRLSLIKFRNQAQIKKRLESLKRPTDSLEKVEENIWVLNPGTVLESINRIPWSFIFDRLNRLNNRRLASEINKAAESLQFDNVVLYIENDFLRAFYLNEMISKVSATVYYIRDYLPSQAYFSTHGKRLEPKMIAKVNMVSTNSEYLMNYALKYNPNSHFVGQGCDLTLFTADNFDIPEDVKPLKRPIIGYTGALLTTRLDIDIIRRIALYNKDWSVVLVGSEDDNFRNSDLHRFENIHFLGRKKRTEIPAYINSFDVCINPQAVNEMTIGNYPLKADEYLAMGKPIVATRTEGMKMFEEYSFLCETPVDYIHGIEQLLAEPQTPVLINSRKSFASSHNWESCVEHLDKALGNTVGKQFQHAG